MSKRAIITGGAGFVGAYLVKRLVHKGWSVGVVDTMIRGDQSRFASVADDVELIAADVRNEEAMTAAFNGADTVFHLAAINGTENFYKQPELVLDVGIRGALAAVNGCRTAGVPDLIVASSAEVYQMPSIVPTPEDIQLMLPNSINPRFSYGGAKIISELIAMNYAQDHFRKMQIFRPHNVYGPDMGWKHVLPQFLVRAADAMEKSSVASTPFPIQGDGSETRAFCYVDDIVDGILTMYENGDHREIYHIGNDEEISIRQLVEIVGETLGGSLDIEPGGAAEGATSRRCPDISKMRAIGFEPKVGLSEGVKKTADWYMERRDSAPANELM